MAIEFDEDIFDSLGFSRGDQKGQALIARYLQQNRNSDWELLGHSVTQTETNENVVSKPQDRNIAVSGFILWLPSGLTTQNGGLVDMDTESETPDPQVLFRQNVSSGTSSQIVLGNTDVVLPGDLGIVASSTNLIFNLWGTFVDGR